MTLTTTDDLASAALVTVATTANAPHLRDLANRMRALEPQLDPQGVQVTSPRHPGTDSIDHLTTARGLLACPRTPDDYLGATAHALVAIAERLPAPGETVAEDERIAAWEAIAEHAEPEDPRVAVVAKVMSDALDDNGVTTCDWTAEARFILAKLDGLDR